MKTKLLALAVLTLGLQGVAHANPVGSDSEGNYYLLPLSTYADQHAGSAGAMSGFPMDAEASFDKAPLDTYADRQARIGSESWGVSKRGAESPFPSGGGYIDD
jgi:hypothetical protein